jgi:alpha-L-fucosidase 2
MDYRLSPKYRWPASRDDVNDAVAWTKTHVQEYGGDPDRIAILGYSAGGQLAFWAAIADQAPHKLKALVGLAPTTDFLEDLGRRGGPSKALRDLMDCQDNEPLERTLLRLYNASPINFIHGGMPPILLIHGTEDRSVPFQQSVHVQRRIEDNRWGVACEIYRVEGAPHRQTEWDRFDQGYRRRLLAWLGEHLD